MTDPGTGGEAVAGDLIIELYGDIVSPWAFLGHRQLRNAVRLLDPALRSTVIIWRPHLVDPTAPSPSVPWADAAVDPAVDAAIQQTTPGTEAGIRRLESGRLAEELGFDRWGPQWRASSWAAHRMITAALDRGPAVQAEVVDAIGIAHFVDGRDINDLELLRDIADRFGLPGPVARQGSAAALAYLQPGVPRDDRVERATREALLFGQAIGISTSPTLVVHDTIISQGNPAAEELAETITAVAADPPRSAPEEVRRFRAARALLEQSRNPRGSLYLLEPLRPEYDGVRGLETLTARALAAAASLEPARAKLAELVARHPDDAYLHLLLGKTLKRMRDPAADKHLAIAAAMNPEYLDF